ncbi:ubiquitin carboxyl-terminal hydrolase 16 isoform 1-T2 [Discoglossus pictus]
MVKKRAKNIHQQDSWDTEPVCKHLRKGLEDGNVKRALVNVEWTACQDCDVDNPSKDAPEEEQLEEPSVWLCLKCGHRGCGRNSEHQHAIKHYSTPRSEPHCLVLNFDTWSVWCYLCDNEVPYTTSSRLGQLVEYIQKKSKNNTKASNLVEANQEVIMVEKVKEKDTKPEDKEPDSNGLAKGDNATNILGNSKETTVKGLSNLGNTCFFNAVMQNLSQTPTLRELLNEVKLTGKTVKIELPDTQLTVKPEQQPGPLTLAMSQFLTDMQETKKGVVTPKELFSQVCKKAIRFKGYQQQDSQELLRYLLDGMRGEEIQRVSAAMSKALHDNSEKLDEDEIKKKVKDCEKRRSIPNFVDRLFGGELTSTIMCEVCQTVSLVHEPFLDLSLPVLDDLLVKKNTPKAFNVTPEKRDEDEDDDSYVKERSDVTSGTSKHLQKKAKKQAKKQAKNQRRQQKYKVISLSDDNTKEECENDAGETSSHNDLEFQSNSKPNDEIQTEIGLDVKDSEDIGNNTETNGQDLDDGAGTNGVNQTYNNEVNAENHMENDAENQQNNVETNIENQENSNETNIECQENKNAMDAANNMEIDAGNMENGIDIDCTGLENNTVHTVTLGSEDGNLHNEPMGERTASPPTEDLFTEKNNMEDELTNNLNRLNLDSGLETSEIEIEIIDDHEPAPTPVYEVVNEDPRTAFCTLSDRKELPADDFSVLSCLYQFTHKENLTGNNQLLCNTCTQKQSNRTSKNIKGEQKNVYTNAKKQMLVSLPPPILTLHLKRFQQNGFNLRKINRHIKFPEVIDLSPFCTVKCKNITGDSRLLYSLYGVIEHSGTMRSGHYTAYVKSRNPSPQLCELVLKGLVPEGAGSEPLYGHWYHISDSHVQAVPVSKVLSSQAYLLFYERML